MKSQKSNSKVESKDEELEYDETRKTGFFGKLSDWLYTNITKKLGAFRYILIWYFLITIFGALLLYAPITQTGNVEIKFIDTWFISTSAFSDTGLTTLVISDAFNPFGQAIIFTLIQLGGIGWFAIKIFLFSWIFKKITTKNLVKAEEEYGDSNDTRALGVIKVATIVTIGSTLVFGLIFGIIFATVPENILIEGVESAQLYGNWGDAMWTGFFHAGASINNAGLDIFLGNTSMSSYYGNIGIQVLTMFLFILGGIGFYVIYDLLRWIKSKKRGVGFEFSLITKLSFYTYFIIAIIGLSATYINESVYANNSELAFLNAYEGTQAEKWWALTFNTFSTRNAGFTTIDINALSQGTQYTWMSMMFIGSGPGSTAGGIRTTTFAILVLSIWALIKNKEKPTAFSRSISNKQVRDSFLIFSASVIFLFISAWLIYLVEFRGTDTQSMFDIIFIISSAFGTTGMSTIDLTQQIHIFTKLWLIITMMIGQMGVITTLRNLNVYNSKTKQIKNIYVDEYVNLGN